MRGISTDIGVTAATDLRGLFVSRAALAGNVPATALKKLDKTLAWHKLTDLDSVTSAQRMPAALASHFDGNATDARSAVETIVAAANPGSVFRKEGSTFVDIAPAGRAGINDTYQGWELGSTFANMRTAGVRKLVSWSHTPTTVAAVGAALIGTAGLAAFHKLTGSASHTDTATGTGPAAPHAARTSLVAAPAEADPKARLAAIAEIARTQVTGDTDHTSDNKLNPTVAAYMRATEGITPSLSRDWTVDFTAWVCRAAGVPIGTKGAGGVDVRDLLDWASEPGVSAPIATAKLTPGQLLVSTNAAGDLATLDIGVVVKVDGDNMQVVYGNRWVNDSPDGNAVGAVRTVIVSRSAKGLLGVIDPTVKHAPDSSVQPTPLAPTPAPATAPASKPAPHPHGSAALTGATVRRRGTPPPVASATAPTRAQLEDYFNWAASQYATDDAQARELSTLAKNVAAVETHFGLNSLNLWDSNAQTHTPSFGIFQFIKPTFDGFSARAKDANPKAWSDLGHVTWSDWRAQTLTTAWALAQPPSNFSRQNNGWAGEHGRYWSRWSSIYNMVNGRGSVPQGDPRTSSYWSNQLKMPAVESARNGPVEARTVWPQSWYSNGHRLSSSQLHEVVRTGQVYGIPSY